MKTVVKEVTQAAYDADGKVTHSPGEQFSKDEAMPEGVLWKYVITDAPDIPEDATPAERRKSLRELLEDPPAGS